MKLPQSTATLVKRLQRVAKAMDREAAMCHAPSQCGADLDGLHEKNAATWRARANTCWQAAGRLEERK